MKLRDQPEKIILQLGETKEHIQAEIARLAADMAAKVVPVEYNG